MRKLTKNDKIGFVLLIIALVVGMSYIYLHQIVSYSPYGLFEIVSFHWGAVWCLLMVIAFRKTKLFENKPVGACEK